MQGQGAHTWAALRSQRRNRTGSQCAASRLAGAAGSCSVSLPGHVGPQAALRQAQTVRASATCSGGWRMARWLGRAGASWVSACTQELELRSSVGWRGVHLCLLQQLGDQQLQGQGAETQLVSASQARPPSRLSVRLATSRGTACFGMLFCVWRRVTSCRHDLGAHAALFCRVVCVA